MCIATAYVDDGNQCEEVMRDVISAESDSGSILLTTILGEQKQLKAKIKHIDFIKHSVTLTPAEQGIS